MTFFRTSTISAECFVEIIKIIIVLFTNIFYTFQQYVLHVLRQNNQCEWFIEICML